MAQALAYDVTGPEDAPPVLLGGSLGSSRAMWDPVLTALAQSCRVIRYDHRGHGASPVPPGPYTISELADDVVALLDRLGVERAHVVGLSLGGMVGMRLAAAAPAKVDRLVLVSTSPWMGDAGYADRARTARTVGLVELAKGSMGRWFTPAYAAERPEVVLGFERMVAATAPEGYAGCAEAIAAMDLRAELPSITAPTLVVAAADDPATPPAQAELIASLIPGARLAVVEDAAHLAVVQQPAALTALITGHLGA